MTSITTITISYIAGIVSSLAITFIYLWKSDFSLISLVRCLFTDNTYRCKSETSNAIK